MFFILLESSQPFRASEDSSFFYLFSVHQIIFYYFCIKNATPKFKQLRNFSRISQKKQYFFQKTNRLSAAGRVPVARSTVFWQAESREGRLTLAA